MTTRIDNPPWASGHPTTILDGLRVDLSYPAERMAENRAMAQAERSFTYADRVPVRIGVSLRYFLHARGVGYREYFGSAAAQVKHQLLNYRWRLAHVHDDTVTAAGAVVSPDLSTLRALAFDPPVHWSDAETPRAIPSLTDPEQVHRLRVPQPESGLAGQRIAWYHEMRELVTQVEVTFNGQPIAVSVKLGSGEGGPFPMALALAGERLFHWAYEAPDVLHALMGITTETFIQQERHVRQLGGAPMGGCGMGCDGAEMLSPRHFAAFVLPYYERVYQAFPGRRGLHMCGRIGHLLDILAGELRIDALNGFGDVLDRQLLATRMGGRALLIGGVKIATLLAGPPEAIAADCRDALETLAPPGGYVLQDGNNVSPGTPLEHLAVLKQASEDYGMPRLRPPLR
ncbi:MAG: hypothetical protein HYY04_09195 [Chloroflexi bacterium]|nr:hypothetical protein [Chloroflexota bacterium]